MAYSTISKIIPLSKITSQLWLIFLLDWSIEEFLSDAVLPCDFFLREPGSSDTEEACCLNLRQLLAYC